VSEPEIYKLILLKIVEIACTKLIGEKGGGNGGWGAEWRSKNSILGQVRKIKLTRSDKYFGSCAQLIFCSVLKYSSDQDKIGGNSILSRAKSKFKKSNNVFYKFRGGGGVNSYPPPPPSHSLFYILNSKILHQD